jgi:hypothetical protein
VEVKNEMPYDKKDQQKIYLDSLARASKQSKGEYRIEGVPSSSMSSVRDQSSDSLQSSLHSMIEQMCLSSGLTSSLSQQRYGIGVDIELNSSINTDTTTSTFIERNFTEKEMSYCMRSPNPRASFCGRWAAKEALLKAICNLKPEVKQHWVKGPGASLKVIFFSSSSNLKVLFSLS